MVRRATAQDVDRLAEINVFSWRTAYRGIVDDDYLYRKLTVSGRLPGLSAALAQGSEQFYVAERNGLVIGFTRFGASRDEELPSASELYAIYIDPGFFRQGAGGELMEHYLAHEHTRACGRSVLWVFKENHSSRRFYEAMGFVSDGGEQSYAGLGQAVRYARPVP